MTYEAPDQPSISPAARVSRRLVVVGERIWTDTLPGAVLNAWGAAVLPHAADRLLAEAWMAASKCLADQLTTDDRFTADRLAEAVRAGAMPYAVVGDSHSRILVRRARRGRRWLLPIHRLLTGASARGLSSTESRSGAGEQLGRDIAPLLRAAPRILLMFGQVDVEFVHPYRRFRAGRTAFDPIELAAFLDETVERYVDALARRIAAADRERIDLVSILPPALSDLAWRRGYRNAHIAQLHGEADGRIDLAGLEIPVAAARVTAHADFNTRLAAAAPALGFGYLDLFAPLMAGPMVDPAFQGPAAGQDHHLDYHATREVVLDRLWPWLGRQAKAG
ncbi:hypothetical protein [Caulobacter sp. DWR2-3-1b2]|uniref:hypothetical protein n=1 Tax=unclassified Caulobacter TaxID=2648921 RepID=UPI003CF77493